MRWFIFFSIVFLSKFIFSQQKFSFPIDTVDITGNFGEIRNNHFHQGLDFSTKGKENYPVKSISEGYIYRIKVSPAGFGKVLYIHHPNGLLSVYAHLNSFSDKIENFVFNYQKNYHSNNIDTLLPENLIKIKSNEIIGYSGNTGSSTGPHLHFELRDELTEIPINPFFYFDIKDTTKPVIHKIIFYDLSDTISPKPIFTNKKSDSIIVPSITGIAFSGIDKIYPKGNPNNIYKVSIYLDNQKIYQHRLHQITFDNTIYVSYYSEKVHNQIFQKCFTSHLYPNFFYDTLINKGRIILKDTNYHTLKISFCDESNNCVDTTLFIKTRQHPNFKKINIKKLILCNQPTHIKNKYFELIIPEKSLFNDIDAKIFYNQEKKQIQFTHTPLPLKFPAKLAVSHNLKLSELHKTVLASHSRYYIPDSFNVNKIYFSVKELSNFYLYTDLKSPTVKPLHFNTKKKAIILTSQQNKIYFKVSDNTTIKNYTVYFNSQFCKSYYYASKGLIVAELPSELIATDENFIQITLTDIVNNTTQKSYKIIFSF